MHYRILQGIPNGQGFLTCYICACCLVRCLSCCEGNSNIWHKSGTWMLFRGEVDVQWQWDWNCGPVKKFVVWFGFVSKTRFNHQNSPPLLEVCSSSLMKIWYSEFQNSHMDICDGGCTVKGVWMQCEWGNWFWKTEGSEYQLHWSVHWSCTEHCTWRTVVLPQWNSYAFSNMGQMCHYAWGLCWT
jgi:hypothetical protein